MVAKVRTIFVGILICLSLIVFATVQTNAQTVKNSIWQVKTNPVKTKLLSPTGKTLVNSVVKIDSDNGIRCIKAPCPTNYKTWEGKTDAKGFILIPTNFIQKVTTVSTPEFPNGTDLIAQSRKDKKNVWIVRLK